MTVTASLERRAPGQDAWPLFGIRITTPRLELRVVDDAVIPELSRVARSGVHEPGHMPFGNGWTDRPDEDWHAGFARYFWLQRGSWNISGGLPAAKFSPGLKKSIIASSRCGASRQYRFEHSRIF